MPRKSTTGSSTSARVVVCGPKPVASASSASAMVAADSTLRKTVARLIASLTRGSLDVLNMIRFGSRRWPHAT
jgi:hypothetical protein